MSSEIQFFFEVLLSGLLTGILYSLVAIGFVLIYKASEVFNFAQGAMVLFAAMTLAGIHGNGVNLVLSGIITLLVMVLLAFSVERFILRRIVNQSPLSMFMATIGLSYFLLGLSQLVWGADVRALDIGIPDDQFIVGEIMIDQFDLTVAAVCLILVLSLVYFFQRTRVGLALRAVADDHQAAISVGVSLHKVWVIVWSIAGFVALVTGIVWGARLGVQPALNLIALKALPVIILGGLSSIPGAIVGGLIIGAGEKLFEIYLGSIFGGATESWVPYVIAIGFLLVRPSGLFGNNQLGRI
ncbi:Inner-membrane translocator [Mesorhizobium metallidurans STM 2683]|uniref:Inner-membrane translocator n=1 Tax=Mesorhizobium metallidurans STM 2683 TaxID=1297569 RepID=M5ENU0_9HYPH|nr:branched-chain amino acid ABC transporter permease [Mesorhizobium metallidurans]CCV06379.1 Inner-membrane translocator [Mesorhizobium metallidurans STM 2683]